MLKREFNTSRSISGLDLLGSITGASLFALQKLIIKRICTVILPDVK
jgi:hypothetical protein